MLRMLFCIITANGFGFVWIDTKRVVRWIFLMKVTFRVIMQQPHRTVSRAHKACNNYLCFARPLNKENNLWWFKQRNNKKWRGNMRRIKSQTEEGMCKPKSACSSSPRAQLFIISPSLNFIITDCFNSRLSSLLHISSLLCAFIFCCCAIFRLLYSLVNDPRQLCRMTWNHGSL